MTVRVIVLPGVRPALSPRTVAELRRTANRMVKAAALRDGRPRELEVGLTLTDDEDIRELNRKYRGRPRPTDVLAFATQEGPGPHVMPGVLGDVIISVDTARRQAARSLLGELTFLWTHGFCHLLGYDHRTDEEEATMNARMRSLIKEARRLT